MKQSHGFWAPTDINHGVRLDVVHVGVLEAELQTAALDGADDARGDGVLQRQGASHRHHELAGAQVGRAAEAKGQQGALR